jgi:hypothetical protein
LAVFCALAQFRLIASILQFRYEASVEAAKGVVMGRPHWRIDQSRVLGPYVVEGLSHLVFDFLAAHVLFSIGALAVAGFLAWRLGAHLGGNDIATALLAFIVFQVAFAFLLGNRWLYVWDFIGVIVFLLFVDFVVSGKSWPWFVGLFAVAIFNRESAQFIALWMIVDPVARWILEKLGHSESAPRDWSMPIAGIGCAAAGFMIVAGLRRALLIEEMGPKIFADAPATSNGMFQFRLLENLHLIGGAFMTSDYGVTFVTMAFIVLFLLGTVIVAACLAYLYPARLLGLSLTYIAMVMALLAFGALFETRIYVELIPLLVAGATLMVSPKARLGFE